jgi:hypothetical protein
VNPGGVFPETDYSNNQLSKTVSFTGDPAHLSLVLYNIGYRMHTGDPLIWPDSQNPDFIWSYMMRLYPLNSLSILVRSHERTDALTAPPCSKANGWLNNYRDWDKSHNTHPPAPYKYYGLVDDTGEYITGCAAGIPSTSASGPTGDSSDGWDFDGLYGDWYTAHELGHTFGERHPGFCKDNSDDTDNHHSQAYISGVISPLFSTNTLMGLDTHDALGAAVFTPLLPTSRDIMTYCSNLWVSDITYQHFLSYLEEWTSNLKMYGPPAPPAAADMLVVEGAIDAATGSASLEPMFVLPDAPLETPTPGQHTILLRSATGVELARYPFTLDVSHEEGFTPPAGVFVENVNAQTVVKLIHAMVPYVAGTTRVEILDTDGTLIGYRAAGANTPSVTLTAPNGGELVTDGALAAWTASDVDGDPLTYNLEFSADNGVTWELIAQSISDTQAGLYRINLKNTAQGLLRVAVSDGIHTAYDTSDAVFTVPNQPPDVKLLKPDSGSVYVAGQTVYMEGFVYDADSGTLDGEALTWVSDLDGELGHGATLSVNTLSPGEHTLTLWANDGAPGGQVAASTHITVYATAADMPPQPDALAASPDMLQIFPMQGLTTARIGLLNTSNSSNVLNWTATADQTWLQLSAASGSTPSDLLVTVDSTALPVGEYSGWVTITWGTQEVKVRVMVTVQLNRMYLPAVSK